MNSDKQQARIQRRVMFVEAEEAALHHLRLSP